MSYEPAEAGEHDSQPVRARPLSRRWLPPGSFSFQSGSRRSRPPGGHPPQPGSSRWPLLDGFTIHARRTESPSPSEFPRPPGFQPGPAPWPVHSPCAESGALEAHTLRCALVSSEARFPDRFTLLGTPGGTCTLTPLPGHMFLALRDFVSRILRIKSQRHHPVCCGQRDQVLRGISRHDEEQVNFSRLIYTPASRPVRVLCNAVVIPLPGNVNNPPVPIPGDGAFHLHSGEAGI
jgi:hypothetical protein